MLNKNMTEQTSYTRFVSPKGKLKLNSSLIMSPTSQTSQTPFYTPKTRVDGGFKSPKYAKPTLDLSQ